MFRRLLAIRDRAAQAACCTPLYDLAMAFGAIPGSHRNRVGKRHVHYILALETAMESRVTCFYGPYTRDVV